MSQAGSDEFLIDLFREEVRTNNQILTEGLVALEQGGAGPERLEAMMRAAHSIKGAARVVNVQPAVDISHAMEDCFVRAQKAELTLTSGDGRHAAGVRGHAARESRERPGPNSQRGWKATATKWPVWWKASRTVVREGKLETPPGPRAPDAAPAAAGAAAAQAERQTSPSPATATTPAPLPAAGRRGAAPYRHGRRSPRPNRRRKPKRAWFASRPGASPGSWAWPASRSSRRGGSSRSPSRCFN